MTATRTHPAARHPVAEASWWPPLLTGVAWAAAVVVWAALDRYLSGGVDWWSVATLAATLAATLLTVAADAGSWWCSGVRKCVLYTGAAVCFAAAATVMVVTVWRYVRSPTSCLACDDPPPITASPPPALNLVAAVTGTTPVPWKGQS